MFSSDLKYYIKMFLVVTFWSSLFHILPPVLHYVSILNISFLRYIIAAFALFFIHYYYIGKFIPKLTVSNWVVLVLMGLLGICLYNIFFLWAEMLVSGNFIAIMYSFAPCLTIVISALMFKDKINHQAKIGIIIALLGAVGTILYYNPNQFIEECTPHSYKPTFGELLSITAMLLLVSYNVLGKSLSLKGIRPLTITTFSSIFGAVFLTIMTIYNNDYSQFKNLDLFFWTNLTYIIIGPTILAYIWLIEAYEKLGVQKTAVFLNMMPFLTIIIGFIFYGKSTSPIIIIMGLVIFMGVYVTNTANKKNNN